MVDIIQDEKKKEKDGVPVIIHRKSSGPDNLKTDIHKKKKEEKIKGDIAKGTARY